MKGPEVADDRDAQTRLQEALPPERPARKRVIQQVVRDLTRDATAAREG